MIKLNVHILSWLVRVNRTNCIARIDPLLGKIPQT